MTVGKEVGEDREGRGRLRTYSLQNFLEVFLMLYILSLCSNFIANC